MKTEQVTDASADVVDNRREVDGEPNPGFGKKVSVPYKYEYAVLESNDEIPGKFSAEQLLSLCNQRLKATANSGARQTAVAPYAPSGNDAARAEIVANALRMWKANGKHQDLTDDERRAKAEAFADSLQA